MKSKINITIKGFNGNKQLITNIVNVKLKVGDEILNIPAICVPIIQSVLSCHNVGKISQIMGQKGHKMADNFSKINPEKPLDMIIGVDSFNLLNINTIAFGKNKSSCFMKCKFGVMPILN